MNKEKTKKNIASLAKRIRELRKEAETIEEYEKKINEIKTNEKRN